MYAKENQPIAVQSSLSERLQLVEERMGQLIQKSENYADYISGNVPQPTEDGKGRPCSNGLAERLSIHLDNMMQAIDILNTHIDRMARAL